MSDRSVTYRSSDGSEESPLRNSLDSEDTRDHVDDDPDDPLSPRASRLSLVSNGANGVSDHHRHHSRRRDGDRHSLAHYPDFVKYLVNEGYESKQMRKVLRTALDRLDGETRRAQEAERRALELAERFKTVNDARLAAQQQVERANAELSMYKVQLDNAQREILRGSDLLKDIEAQRDDAEAAAARARSTARRLKEEKMVNLAREQGHKQGFEEGMRRGYEQARAAGYNQRPLEIEDRAGEDVHDFTSGFEGSVHDMPGRTAPLDELSPMLRLPSPYRDDPPHPPSLAAILEDPIPPANAYGGGIEGSRFREDIASPRPSTVGSMARMSGVQPSGPSAWPTPPSDDPRYIHPISVHNAPPSPRHAGYAIPPDGYIPAADSDKFIPMPPPHELNPQPPVSPSSPVPSFQTTRPVSDRPVNPSSRPSTDPPSVYNRDYAYRQRQRGSPRSMTESLPSTTMSQFDLLSSPRTRRSGLSAIQEVSSSLETSPGTVRSAVMPEPVTFPMASGSANAVGSGPAVEPSEFPFPRGERDDSSGMHRPRSRHDRQRIADSLRYSNPEELEEWRQMAADEAIRFPRALVLPDYVQAPSAHRRSRSMQSPLSDGRSHLGSDTTSRDHRRTSSSSHEITIRIDPPSGSGSIVSPASMRHEGMLTPDSPSRPLPSPQPLVPTVPNTPTTANAPMPGVFPGMNASGLPLGFVPMGAPVATPNNPLSNIPLAQSSPKLPLQNIFSGTGPDLAAFAGTSPSPARTGFSPAPRSTSRTGSVGHSGSMNGDPMRPKTPATRPSSSLGGSRSPSTRPHTPSRLQYSMSRPPTEQGTYHDVPVSLRAHARTPSNASTNDLAQGAAHEALSPRSTSSRLSGHQRSFSLNAGSTPAMVPRPLSSASRPQLRRVPSSGSVASDMSRRSGSFQHYDPNSYLDAAFLASTDDLSGVQSPNTMANTRANAAPVPGELRAASPALSYASLRSRKSSGR
ncbi:hypothetical protein A0H81_09710 [Grifola frondosa]|uniref:Uncharacterized protein n=1 Tax=Grifola frondosa TaxID=5627 RepID=A0A1C7LZX2_GRIFR|nr:hypothetical protein A0H81_09710 [Grifola frondosa]